MVAGERMMEGDDAIPSVLRYWTPTGDRVAIYVVGQDGHSKTGLTLTPQVAHLLGLWVLAETPEQHAGLRREDQPTA